MAPKIFDLFKSKPLAAALPDDRYARALLLQQEGKLEPAIELFDEVIAEQPQHAEAHYKRANALNQLQKWEDALAGYDRAVQIDPNFAYAFCNRGTVLERLRRWDEALQSYEQAVALNPGDALTLFNRGSVLKELKRFDAALASYEQAVTQRPDYVEAYVNRGHVLQEMSRFEEALTSYDKAIELAPVYPAAFVGRGRALQKLNRNQEALENLERAGELQADYANIYAHQAAALCGLHQYEEAAQLFGRALSLQPDNAELNYLLGFVLVLLKRVEEGLARYDRALALEPDYKFLIGLRQHSAMQICRWTELESSLPQVVQGLKAGRKVAPPLSALGLVDSPSLHRAAAEIFAQQECPADGSLGALAPHPRSDKIRVGYFSADFRVHPVSLLIAGLIEGHDRTRFEIYAFAFGADVPDHIRIRLRGAFDHFIDVDQQSNEEVALLARKMRIDIAVDLMGFTHNCRPTIFALRAAPVQINFLGYAGTLGTDYMDYLVADHVLIPPGSQQHYCEKIIYLPDSYQPNDSEREISERIFTREELGLPPEGFVFCCFNRAFKLLPATFDTWMNILRRVSGSVLWLSEDSASVVANLQREAEARGVDGGRLVFAKMMTGLEHHLSRHRSAGLFLDTLPFNAHTTASDALWTGVPVVTCMGEAMPGRVAASLLHAVGLPELITSTLAEYEELAVRLATHPVELEEIREKLARHRLNAPLFDTARYTRNLEAAYEQAYERSQAGLAPEHIIVGQ
jgi:predicted O-linked N-acetylglucosamine transferase (SPINDLY family)